MKPPATRQWVIFGALGLSLAATAWVAREEEPQAMATMPRRAPPGSTQPDWPAPAASARAAWPVADAQARAAWGEAESVITAAPIAPPAAVGTDEAPPPPVAPPFPYQLVGRLSDGSTRAVLDSARRSAVVGTGDLVDGEWRVDAVEPAGLRLTYLPLGLPQFIPFAAT